MRNKNIAMLPCFTLTLQIHNFLAGSLFWCSVKCCSDQATNNLFNLDSTAITWVHNLIKIWKQSKINWGIRFKIKDLILAHLISSTCFLTSRMQKLEEPRRGILINTQFPRFHTRCTPCYLSLPLVIDLEWLGMKQRHFLSCCGLHPQVVYQIYKRRPIASQRMKYESHLAWCVGLGNPGKIVKKIYETSVLLVISVWGRTVTNRCALLVNKLTFLNSS